MTQTMKLSGKNTIVTGGSQGLGRAIVEAFLREGASVLFCARSAADVQAALEAYKPLAIGNAKVLGTTADVSKPAEVAALFTLADQQLGPLDVLVNNAGVYGPLGPTEDVPWDEWQQAIEINLFGVMHTCRQAIPRLRTRGGGKIVNISGGGATNPLPRISAYAASKAAVVRLSETLALELAADRIDVNAVAPGALNTRLVQQIIAAGPEKVGADFFAKNKKWSEEGATPPELGAGLCVWLASTESNGITGRLLSAQWDPWKDLAARRDELAKSDIYCLRRIVPEDRGRKWS